jgi:hypothetical protein
MGGYCGEQKRRMGSRRCPDGGHHETHNTTSILFGRPSRKCSPEESPPRTGDQTGGYPTPAPNFSRLPLSNRESRTVASLATARAMTERVSEGNNVATWTHDYVDGIATDAHAHTIRDTCDAGNRASTASRVNAPDVSYVTVIIY